MTPTLAPDDPGEEGAGIPNSEFRIHFLYFTEHP